MVIDFIDMGPQKNQREVENRLRESVRQDRARVQIGKITRFGLLEMSRQRLRPSIGESAYQTCPRCSGFGTIRSTDSLALAILRIVGEEARKERTAKVIAQLPVEVATYLLNEKRDMVRSLETSHDTQVVLVANPALETPHYDVRRVRDDQTELPENTGVSYSLAEVDMEAEVPQSIEERKVAEAAAVGVIKPTTPAPARAPAPEPESGGFWAWLKGLFTSEEDTKKPASKKRPTRKKGSSQSRRGRGGRDQKRGRGRGGERKQADDRQRSKKKTGTKKKASKKKTASGSRSRRQQDQDKKDGTKQQQGQQTQKPEEAQGEPKRQSRGRRSRGGRRRRRGGERRDAQQPETKQTEAGGAPLPAQSAPETQPKQDKKPETKAAAPEAKQDRPSGPPKARTDAERAADAEKKPAAPVKPAEDASAPTAEPQSESGGKPAAARSESKAPAQKRDDAKPKEAAEQADESSKPAPSAP